MIKNKTDYLATIVVVVIIVYLGFVWTHSVFEGRLDFDIFSKGNYKGVLFAVIGGILWTVIANHYDKKKKGRKKKTGKKGSNKES
jgi:hypothetical protein